MIVHVLSYRFLLPFLFFFLPSLLLLHASETAGSDCSRCDNPPPQYPWGRSSFAPPCEGDCMHEVGLGGNSIVDVVKVPKNIKPGKYVVGFRYDCDATAQVWSNCADVTIVA